jgi:hypothetical protein
MLKDTQTQFKRLREWFLTGHIDQPVLSQEQETINAMRKQLKEQLQLLQSRGLPIKIVSV